MCVITINQNKKLNKEDIKKIWNSNPDGAGIIYYKNGQLRFKKGIMNLKKFLEIYEKIELPHIVHFRLASIGKIVPELTHPFPVFENNKLEGKSRLLFAHNGHIGNYEILYHYLKEMGVKFDDNVNDSYVLARSLSLLPEKQIEEFINKVIGGSKMVLVYPDYKIKKFGNFIEEDGIEYSNISWAYGYYDYYKNYQKSLGFETYIPYKYRIDEDEEKRWIS
jgi:glucosamine 6-phosphate synthetase-like amidotransferase/phosphosugar isomerase protein